MRRQTTRMEKNGKYVNNHNNTNNNYTKFTRILVNFVELADPYRKGYPLM